MLIGVPVTALYAGPGALLLLALAVRISRYRSHFKIDLGDSGHPELMRAVRGHGSASSACSRCSIAADRGTQPRERAAAPRVLVLVAARVARGAGLPRSSGDSGARFAGTATSGVVIAVLAAWGIVAFARTVI